MNDVIAIALVALSLTAVDSRIVGVTPFTAVGRVLTVTEQRSMSPAHTLQRSWVTAATPSSLRAECSPGGLCTSALLGSCTPRSAYAVDGPPGSNTYVATYFCNDPHAGQCVKLHGTYIAGEPVVTKIKPVPDKHCTGT